MTWDALKTHDCRLLGLYFLVFLHAEQNDIKKRFQVGWFPDANLLHIFEKTTKEHQTFFRFKKDPIDKFTFILAATRYLAFDIIDDFSCLFQSDLEARW